MNNCHHDPFTFDRWRLMLVQPGVCLRCGEVIVRGHYARREWRVMHPDFLLWLSRRHTGIYRELFAEQRDVRDLITAMPRIVTDRFQLSVPDLIVALGK